MTDATMPLTAHLEELRWRLVKALVAVMIAFTGCYFFSDRVFELLTRPLVDLGDSRLQLIGTGITEAFFTRLKVSIIAAVFVASPVIFYQFWGFIEPGLVDRERRTAIPFVLAATVFFVSGAAFCYVVVFPVGYAFFLEEYATIGVAPQIRISEYLSFASRLLFAFGIPFGPNIAVHSENSMPPLNPACSMVGTSGRIFMRLALVTPSALIAPVRTCGAAVAGLRNPISICPPSRSCITGPAPR